jgi:hypothetical protein
MKVSFCVTDGAIAIQVDVSPRDPMVRVGQNFTFMCRVAKPLMYCRIQLPGMTSGLNLNEKTPSKPEYSYAGDSIQSGQCGITINRITDAHNGQFKCMVGFQGDADESVGTSNVTVASKN